MHPKSFVSNFWGAVQDMVGLFFSILNEAQTTQLDAFLDFMIEIRKDMSRNSTKISKYDLLINLTQNKDEVNRLWSEISKINT